jgi:glyoxalase/bleomycin resistance protein/dioxygenase superfamily protein
MIQHIGYVVEDLPSAIERFARDLGAGPFRVMEHIPLQATFEGAPAHYDHSSAFAAWGPIVVELTQVHDAQPAGLAAAFTQPGAGLGHIGVLADDQAAEVTRLEALGMHVFHTGRTGPVSAVWLNGGPFGHPVEVLQRVPELDAFYASLR